MLCWFKALRVASLTNLIRYNYLIIASNYHFVSIEITVHRPEHTILNHISQLLFKNVLIMLSPYVFNNWYVNWKKLNNFHRFNEVLKRKYCDFSFQCADGDSLETNIFLLHSISLPHNVIRISIDKLKVLTETIYDDEEDPDEDSPSRQHEDRIWSTTRETLNFKNQTKKENK